METDPIFSRRADLPGFVSYPLLETEEGRAWLAGCARALIAVGREHGTGDILETAPWVANRDRASAPDYGPARVMTSNRQAVALVAALREEEAEGVVRVVSANVDPRGDACAHAEQIAIPGGDGS